MLSAISHISTGARVSKLNAALITAAYAFNSPAHALDDSEAAQGALTSTGARSHNP